VVSLQKAALNKQQNTIIKYVPRFQAAIPWLKVLDYGMLEIKFSVLK